MRDHDARQGLVQRELPAQYAGESIEQKRQALENALDATPSEQRRLINESRRTIQLVSEEYVSANAGDTNIAINVQYSNNVIRIGTVIAQGPVGATSMTLTLGARKYRFANAGPIYWPDYKGLVKPDDVRSLTWAGANPVGGGDTFLHLIGEQLPQVDF